jgi:hypothetical protein
VSRADVEGCVDKAIELGQAGLTWFRDGLPIAERVMLSAVAAAQSISESTSSPKNPLDLLEENGVVITEDLRRSLGKLTEWGFVKSSGKTFTGKTYKIRIKLVNQWLTKKYLIGNEIQELENISERATLIYEEFGTSMESAKTLFEKVLEINPNHFSALFHLAEIQLNKYLENSSTRVSESIALRHFCERIYKINPSKFRSNFVRFLLRFGQEQLLENNIGVAQESFERVLMITSEDLETQRAILRIVEDSTAASLEKALSVGKN